jgi:phosphatidylglycerol---prolipoprotein diacylglyceryl transferase
MALFTYPDFDPVAFSIGPILGKTLDVRWYGLMYLGGFLIAWLGMRLRAKAAWSKFTAAQVDDIVFYCALGAILGGRVGYMLVYATHELVENPLSLFTVWNGGMSFHGGLTGVIVAMALYARHVRQPFFVLTDFIAPWAPAGLMLGRLGNFINGELWGKPTRPDAPWAVIVDGEARHASQLYEAFLEGLLLFLILWLYTKKPRPTMATSGLFLIGYGAARIVVEFVRVPDAQMGYLAFGWVTTGQVLSVPMVLAGAALFALALRRGAASRAEPPAEPAPMGAAKKAR